MKITPQQVSSILSYVKNTRPQDPMVFEYVKKIIVDDAQHLEIALGLTEESLHNLAEVFVSNYESSLVPESEKIHLTSPKFTDPPFMNADGTLNTITPPQSLDRVLGGLYGLLVGDALGVPYEFKSPQHLPPLEQIDFEPPRGFARSHASTPAGTWSDDGAMALCFLQSLLYCKGLNPHDLAQRFVNWETLGHLAVDGRVFDIGIQTSRALTALRQGVPPLEAGSAQESAQGNGSLMRVLPLVLWHRGSDAELVRLAQEQSRLTHAHPNVLVCCALYCLWARGVLGGLGIGVAWDEAVLGLRGVYAGDVGLLAALDVVLAFDAPKGSGFVIDTLHSARLVLSDAQDFAGVVRGAVALGYDTDTTACVAGGLAGLHFGVSGIPQVWLDALRGQDLLAPMVAGLGERLG